MAISYGRNQFQSSPQLRYSFCHCRAGDCLLSRFQRIANRFVSETSFRAMLCHELRLCHDDLMELAFERLGNPRVKLLASSSEQGAVGDVLHQCVLEGVHGVRWCSTLEDQLCINQL